MTKADGDKAKIKNDAKGAMAPSQADAKNNGVLGSQLDGGPDATRKSDDHSAPTTPRTGPVPKAGRR